MQVSNPTPEQDTVLDDIDITLTDNASEKYVWDELKIIYLETIESISGQVALVEELHTQYVANQEVIEDNLSDEFRGLKLSFTDLAKFATEVGLKHCTESESVAVEATNKEILIPTAFMVGPVVTRADEYEYLNIATKYLNLQEMVTNIITTGWVDLFTTLKIGTSDLTNTIVEGSKTICDAQGDN